MTVQAYRRENGRVGVRNHVLILPVDDISNAACEAVANNVKGTLAIPHAYGRLQFGEGLELHFRTMIGTGANPNVHSGVVIGIEPGWTKRIADGIRETGKEVAFRLKGAAESITSVFLPTTPNPTSGFLLFVPTHDLIVLTMSVEEAAKLVISAGLVAPDVDEDGSPAEIAAKREGIDLAAETKRREAEDA